MSITIDFVAFGSNFTADFSFYHDLSIYMFVFPGFFFFCGVSFLIVEFASSSPM